MNEGTEKLNIEQPDYSFLNNDDKEAGIETATYKNGNQVKRFKISGDRVVVARELIGHDMMKIDNIIAKTPDQYMPALFHFAVKIDGKQIPMEEFENFKGKDFNKIKLQVLSLNF